MALHSDLNTLTLDLRQRIPLDGNLTNVWLNDTNSTVFRLNDSNTSQVLKEEEYDLLYEAPIGIITLLSILYGGISIVAVIGNTLVIWIVATTRQMHTVTNMYIANLAFADVIIGMFCIPFQFQAALLQMWNLPEFMCAFCPFIQVVSVNVSVFTLTAIAVDRHRAIINPLRARPTKFISKIIIACIWGAATSFAVPIAIAFRVIPETDPIRRNGVVVNITRPFCNNANLTDEQLQTYRYYLVFVQYVVPFCVISFVYIQMAVRLWGSKTPGNAQDSRDVALLKNKKKVIKMLIIVVIVFGLCWLPLQTYNILYVTWKEINEYQFINIIWFCCDWLAMSNSCYNPFIYGIYNEKFKREFSRRFSCCCFAGENHDTHDKTTSVYTRASSIRSTFVQTSTRFRNNTIAQRNASLAGAAEQYAFDFAKNQQINNNRDSGIEEKDEILNSEGWSRGNHENARTVCHGTNCTGKCVDETDDMMMLSNPPIGKCCCHQHSHRPGDNLIMEEDDDFEIVTSQRQNSGNDIEMADYCLLNKSCVNNFSERENTNSANINVGRRNRSDGVNTVTFNNF